MRTVKTAERVRVWAAGVIGYRSHRNAGREIYHALPRMTGADRRGPGSTALRGWGTVAPTQPARVRPGCWTLGRSTGAARAARGANEGKVCRARRLPPYRRRE